MANLYDIYCVRKKADDNIKVKSFFLTNFQGSLKFTPGRGIHGNPKIVPSKEANLVDNAMASIIGDGLIDNEITIAFANIINHKLKYEELSTNFHLST